MLCVRQVKDGAIISGVKSQSIKCTYNQCTEHKYFLTYECQAFPFSFCFASKLISLLMSCPLKILF